MATSRYRNTPLIDGKYQATFEFPEIDWSKINTFSVRITDSDRMDTLAHKYFNDGTLYWVIMLVNEIHWPWDFASGQIIRIPVDVNDVLKYF